MANIINNYASTIVTIYQSVINDYELNLDIIKQTEEELNDLNHEIELSASKDMYKGYLLYKEIRDLRLKRRKAKEENEFLKDMYDFFKGQQGQEFKRKVQKIQGDSAKIREAQEHRTYAPRQRSDLTCTNETCTAHKLFEDMLLEFNKNKAYVKNGKLRK